MDITLNELIEKLTDLRDDLDGRGLDADAMPVTFAIQPNYPIAVGFGEVTAILDGEKGPRVWVATSESPSYDINPYAPRQAWEGDVVTAACDECEGEGCDECECPECDGNGCIECLSTGKRVSA